MRIHAMYFVNSNITYVFSEQRLGKILRSCTENHFQLSFYNIFIENSTLWTDEKALK